MPAKSRTAPVEEANEETQTEEAVGNEVAVVDEEEVASVAPQTKSFTANNTWTAYYGHQVYSFIEGKTYELPVEVANWFSRQS